MTPDKTMKFEIYSCTFSYLMIIYSKVLLNQLCGVGWTYKMEQNGLTEQEQTAGTFYFMYAPVNLNSHSNILQYYCKG